MKNKKGNGTELIKRAKGLRILCRHNVYRSVKGKLIYVGVRRGIVLLF